MSEESFTFNTKEEGIQHYFDLLKTWRSQKSSEEEFMKMIADVFYWKGEIHQINQELIKENSQLREELKRNK